MGKKIKAKFSRISMLVFLYFELLCFYLFLILFVKTNRGRIWFMCCLKMAITYYNSDLSML